MDLNMWPSSSEKNGTKTCKIAQNGTFTCLSAVLALVSFDF